MTSRTCCVPKCESHRKHIRLHEVPSRRQPRSRIKWIMAILSNFPDINTEESERLKSSKWQFVCHKHFEKKFVNSTMRLRNGCFPTLFTEREIATGVPNVDPKTILQETTRIATIDHMYYTIQKIHIDHTYSKTDEDEDSWMDHLPFPTKSGNLPTDTADADAAASRDAQSALQEDEPAFEEDNNQTESDSRLPKDEVMIDYIIEHPASPGRDIFETIEPEDPKKGTVFSWEKMELLETDDPEDEVLVPETKIPEDPPTLSLFCEEPDKPPVGTPSKPEAVVPEDVVYRCVDCAVVVDGFTFWCVQCLCGVMCGACAAMSPHDIHYVLRAPKGATLSQTQPVLLVIREQLQKENLLTLYGTDVDGVKVEVKLEPEEPLSPPAPTPPPDLEDPLAIEPHSEVGESQTEPVEPHSKAVQLHMELEHENVESHSEAVHSVEGVETQSEAVQFYVEGAEDPEELQTAAVQIFHEGVEPQSEAVQFYLEGEEPHIEEPQPVQISLEGVDHQSEAVQFYLDGVEPHPEAVQFYLEAVERGTDAVLLQVESTAPGTEVELHHEAVRPDNEARELRLDAIVEKRVNKETVDHHHPFKRPRLMDIRPGDKLYPTTSPKVSDVQNQTLRRIPPTIISQTVFRLPNTIPSSRTGSQILQKIQPSDLRQSKTLSKSSSSPTELLVPQNVHKGPNILRRPKAKVEVGKSALSKQDKVQNIAKGSPLIRTQQINPRGSALQVPQNVGFSELKVTSGPKRYETVIVNSDDDVEFLDEVVLDWNDSENEVESRLDKENQDENRIGKELVGDIESELVKDDLEDRIDRLDKGNRDDDSSDDSAESKDSSKDKESEIDDDDLDEDFRIDEQDRIDEDSTDETDSVEGVVRRTRHARNTTVGSQRKMVRTPSDAVVQLQRLTSLDIRNWTARSKSRRKD